MTSNMNYGVRLAVLYTIIWFIDLLDSTLLNVALPEIAQFFQIDPTQAEWALIGFLLAMAIGMLVSHPTGNYFGVRRIYLSAQWLYLFSSLACGLSINFPQLVFFRIFQGFAGGLAIPIGLALFMREMPHDKWAKAGVWVNLFALIAPAVGPILAGHIMDALNWRWLFFFKLPISFVCIVLSYFWVQKTARKKDQKFDWLGFYFIALSLSLLLLVLSEVERGLFSNRMLLFLFLLSLVFLGAFIWQEKRAIHPLIPPKIFHYPLFVWGNLVQSAANVIFLGATFIIALYLQWGLGYSIIKTGWVMSAVTVGMACAMLFTGRFYNRLGPLPFMIPSLLIMAFSMFGFIWIKPETSAWVAVLFIFLEGFSSAALQSTNFVSIFSEIPNTLKATGSSLYTLFKQVSASIGVALSTMVLSVSMSLQGVSELSHRTSRTLFFASFAVLGIIPLLALICTFFIDNKKALKKISTHDHLDTEFEHGVE